MVHHIGRLCNLHKCLIVHLFYLELVEEALLFRRQLFHHPSVDLDVDDQPEEPQDPDAAEKDVEILPINVLLNSRTVYLFPQVAISPPSS